jgi:hypothetical protein
MHLVDHHLVHFLRQRHVRWFKCVCKIYVFSVDFPILVHELEVEQGGGLHHAHRTYALRSFRA